MYIYEKKKNSFFIASISSILSEYYINPDSLNRINNNTLVY